MQPIIHNVEQRSPEWYMLREGKITASTITNILGKESLVTTQKAIKNISMKLAIEAVHGMIENDYVSFDMQRGIDQEPSAFNLLSDILAKDFIQLNKVGFVTYSEHIGCSPDGIASNNSNAEIKCPNAENFLSYKSQKK